MIVVDSSGWVEFLQGTSRAGMFEPALRRLDEVWVPGISLFEVHRLILLKESESAADRSISIMKAAQVVDLDGTLAVEASKVARAHKLSLADAIIYATAQNKGAELWTQDAHFEHLPGVKYFPKP
ncbi:MAG: type II toxin-antitoxin system VapC family toxin [Terrimicrobiaceae bacterium]|jgi:predicted nucleic acid-binding protein|nr:type II toxin-antitoxin system VapC family toxin [Terrimicrobiaceae bacterium]